MMRTLPAPSSMMFAGFRSRCSTPRSCAAARPAQICRAISMRLVLRQPADAAQQRRQILAVDVLHREEELAVELADVVDAADVRVRDLPRRPHFVVELREPHGIAARDRGRNFSATGWPSRRSSAR